LFHLQKLFLNEETNTVSTATAKETRSIANYVIFMARAIKTLLPAHS
jgi:hypothetical protein